LALSNSRKKVRKEEGEIQEIEKKGGETLISHTVHDGDISFEFGISISSL
jgi:hypothetical protein